MYATQVIWSPGVSLEAMERQIVIAAYAFYKQNKTATAQSLGIAIRTLDAKLEKYAMDNLEQEMREDDARARREDFRRRERAIPQGAGYDNGATPRVVFGKENGDKTGGGVPVQSAIEPAEKSGMSLPKRKEI